MIEEKPGLLNFLRVHVRGVKAWHIAIGFKKLLNCLTLFVNTVNLRAVDLCLIGSNRYGAHLRVVIAELN